MRKLRSNFDWSLIVVPLALAVASVATLYSITSISGKSYLAINQIIFFAIGALIYIIFAALNYQNLRSYSWYLYFGGLILLIAVFFFGQKILGSRRWIELGFTQIQPSEIMKFILLVFSASFFMPSGKIRAARIVLYLTAVAIPIILIVLQPDLGTALTLMALALSVLIAAKIPKIFFIFLAVALVLISPVVWFKLKPYQKQRVVSFIDPAADPLGSGYNVTQSKIAVGSGGLYGKGFGGATQSQLQFLPIAYIDFVFSGWAEATGFVGSVLMVVAFTVLVWRLFSIASASRDRFGLIFCIGAGGMIFFQVFVNIGMNIGVMPVTGIPLPFISSGGTSILTSAAILGVAQSIYLRRKSLSFE